MINLAGTGIGRLSGLAETAETEKILENYTKRLKSGRIGLHEGRRKKKVAE